MNQGKKLKLSCNNHSINKILNLISTHTILLFIIILISAPILWIFTTSIKPYEEIFITPIQWIPINPTIQNFIEILERFPFLQFFKNSLVVSVSVVIAQLITCSLSAYAFSWLEFPGREFLFLAFLATMMIPSQVRIIPTYIILSEFDWIDKIQALTVPFFANALGTFLIRQSFKSVPADLIDAARLDGANHIQILTKCLIPLSTSTYITYILLSFTWRWNDYFWPLIMTNSTKMRTLSVGLVYLKESEGGTQWNLIMAGTVIILIPLIILFIFAQKYFIQGISKTGTKG